MHNKAWLVVAGKDKIPNFPIVAPYIAISIEPFGFNLTEVSSSAKLVILLGTSSIIPLFKSPVKSQGIVPFL